MTFRRVMGRGAWLFAGVAALVSVQCGRTADTGAGDAGDADAALPDPDRDSAIGADSAAAADGARPEAAADAARPVVPCTEADASACDVLPGSTCADLTSVRYVTGGTCVGGVCVWDEKVMKCGFQSYCANGGCTPPTTK